MWRDAAIGPTVPQKGKEEITADTAYLTHQKRDAVQNGLSSAAAHVELGSSGIVRGEAAKRAIAKGEHGQKEVGEQAGQANAEK